MNNTCVCCGAMIPEGCQVCKACEEGFIAQTSNEEQEASDYPNRMPTQDK